MPRVKLNTGLFVFVRPSPVGYESSSNFTIQVNLPEYPPEKAALNCGQEHTMVPGRRSDVPGPRPEFPTMVRFSPRATGPQDTGPPDTGPPDTGPLDHRTPDHRTPDHRTPTTGSAAPDTGQPDTGPPDHNYSCVRRGAYHDPPAQATIPLGKLVYPLGPGVPASSQTPFSWCWRHGFGKSMGVRQGSSQMALKRKWTTFISQYPPDSCRRPWGIFEEDCEDLYGRVPSVADTWEPGPLARAPCLGPPALGPRPWPADQAGTAGPTAPAVAA